MEIKCKYTDEYVEFWHDGRQCAYRIFVLDESVEFWRNGDWIDAVEIIDEGIEHLIITVKALLSYGMAYVDDYT